MAGNTYARVGHVYERWHEAIVGRDLDGLMALYADDATLETSLSLVTLTDRAQGILKGKSEIRRFFEAGLRNFGKHLGRWHRTRVFFSNGRQLVWEYPRETPQGDQADGLIAHHRVYWGWVGFRALVGATETGAPQVGAHR